MAYFNYVAKSEAGRTIKGREFAISEHELVMRLSQKGLTVVSVKRDSKPDFITRFTAKRRSLSVTDQMVFCRQLSTLLKGGIPLLRGLEIIAGETENITVQAAITEVAHYIKQGDSFSASLKRLPGLFSGLFIALVEAGEKVGALDVMLARLAKYLVAQERLARKIITAIAYPSAVLIFFTGAVAFMTLVLVPKFRSMYESFHAQLPAFTVVIFAISDFMVKNIFYIAGGIILIVLFIQNIALKSKRGRYAFAYMGLHMPVFGNVLKKAALSKFTRTLATLLEQGIAVPEALDLVAKTSGNVIIEIATAQVAKAITDGSKIPDAFRKAGVFPPLVIQMATVGTESGNLPELFDKTADFYEEEVDMFLGIMSALIEPALIIVLGVVLGIFIVALYLPIFKLSQAVGGKT